MRSVVLVLAFCAGFASGALADPAADFEAARQKWRAAGIKSYSFLYELDGAVVVAPRCSDAKIRVIVRDGVSTTPVVARAGSKCPRGARGEAIGLRVPAKVEELFAEIRRYLYEPPVEATVRATYDPTWGVPLTYSVTKRTIADNDEGFVVSEFKRL